MGNESSTTQSTGSLSEDIRCLAKSSKLCESKPERLMSLCQTPTKSFGYEVPTALLPHLANETRHCFTLDLEQFTRLLEPLQVEYQTLEAVFRVFEIKQNGRSDACETLAGLVLAAPHLSSETKQQVFFRMFNVAMHRKDQMTADEAILLFRTVTMAASKMLSTIKSTAPESAASPPSTQYFENLAKVVYGEQEVLSAAEFSLACQANAAISAFLVQWPQEVD